MSGLSSRVMNMKFMRGTDTPSEQHRKENDPKKVKDTSEWALKDSCYILSNNHKVVQSVGYGDINRFGDSDSEDETIPKSVKRSWGEKESDSIEYNSIKESTETKNETGEQEGDTKETTKKGSTKGKKGKQTTKPQQIDTQSIELPDNVNELDSNTFLNTVFQPKKRSNSVTDAPKKKLKKRKRNTKK